MIMKIKKHKIGAIILVLVIVIISFMYYFSTSINYLPKGNYLYSVESPNKEFKLNAYIVNGGSLSGDAIRVELENSINNNTKNIYWKYPISNVDINWLDNSNVIINDIKLNIHTDIYKSK